ncbi:MAG: HAD family phosphatase [Chloroflexi bacterium]|nr:HAD family phosphatase [Chloroflexota bacterium]
MSLTKSVIWDLDGVIVDTAPYHFEAWREVFRKRGIDFTREHFKESFGQRNDAIIRKVLGEEVSQQEIDVISLEKEEIFRRKVKPNLKLLPGVLGLLESLARDGFKMALASSAPIENIRLVTEGLDIGRYFQIIVSDKDVTEGKPSPQGFLLAAQRLGIDPSRCIVIEDSIAGVAAAKRAGMHCLAVINTHPRESLGEADLIVDTLEKVTTKDLEKLIGSYQ